MVNYNSDAIQTYITTEIEYLPGEDKTRDMDASMSLLSVTGCTTPNFIPPTGAARYNLTSPPTTIPMDGYILSSIGHLHDGGVGIQLELNGRLICDSKAIYGGAGSETIGADGKKWATISSMTECNDPVPVKAGDKVTTVAVYDTDLHPLRHAAHGHGDAESMGVFFVNFAAKTH
ncbi:hypothetical protein BT63DRAFT_426879 [Microthyrium microscopicum]|uniref:Uncharacterized protein n=1 Tax=Microthyrium microscopicum TaxID=703497 RepID=A0A6A6U9R0_9PEZI|nr:hypothetical protein BT63DRAFT_426879 [Microthyrium microscopicum]